MGGGTNNKLVRVKLDLDPSNNISCSSFVDEKTWLRVLFVTKNVVSCSSLVNIYLTKGMVNKLMLK